MDSPEYEFDTQFEQRVAHQRYFGDGVMLAMGDQEPVILEGLAADLWVVAEHPTSIRQAHHDLSIKYGDSSREFSTAFDESVRLVRPLLMPVSNTNETRTPSIQKRASLPAWQGCEFGKNVESLTNALGWDAPHAANLLAAAQVSIGRPVETCATLSELPGGPLPAFRQRVLPGMLAVIKQDSREIPPDVLSSFIRQDATVQRHAIRCEQVLFHTVSVLEDLGVGYVALKGIVTAHLEYPQPHLRQFGDVDILVRSGEHRRVIEVLRQAGYRHIVGGDPGAFELYKSNYLIAPNGVELDLHHRLFRHGLDQSEIWVDRDEVMIAQRAIVAPNRTWRLLHACAHAMLSTGGTRRLSGYLDPVRIAHNDADTIAQMIDTAARLQLGRLVASALELSHRYLDIEFSPELPRSTGIRDTVGLWAFNTNHRHALREQISLLLGLPPKQAARWVAAWIQPSSQYSGQRVLERLRSSTQSRSRRP